MKIEALYLDGSYLDANPSWDRDDSAWKADLVIKMLNMWSINPTSLCEVGCGLGDILHSLSLAFPATCLVGYDVSPQVSKFWNNDIKYSGKKIDLVFQHVRDPFTFLEESRAYEKLNNE